MPWARIVDNTVHEIWAIKPRFTRPVMDTIVQKTMEELSALGWQPPPPPPPPPTPLERLEQEMVQSKILFALLNRERIQRGLTKKQLFDELKTFLPGN